MATRATLDGTVEDRNGGVHGVFEELGYYAEEPIEVLREFATSCRIRNYKGFVAPFGSEFGLSIEEANQIPGKFSVRPLRYLHNELKGIEITANPSGRHNPNDSCEIYNPLPIEYYPLYEKPRKLKDLKENFLHRVNESYSIGGSFDSVSPKNIAYWQRLDEKALRVLYNKIKIILKSNKKNIQRVTDFYNKYINERFFTKNKGISLDSVILEIIQNFPELPAGITKQVYDEVCKECGILAPVEMLEIFGVKNGTYFDLKKMVRPLKKAC